MADEATLRRLVLTKHLYLEGADKSHSEHNYIDQLSAPIYFFLAIETLMGAVVSEINEQPDHVIGTKGYWDGKVPSPEQVSKFKLGGFNNFSQLYNQVVAILRNNGNLGPDEILFRRGPLERLQKARNDAQHSAKAPHPDELSELAKSAADLIERLLHLFFQPLTSLAEVSLAVLIEDDVLRQYMKSAEHALAQERLRTCALLIRIAFLLGRLKRRYDWWSERNLNHIIDDYDVSHELSQDWGARPLDGPSSRLLYNMVTETGKLPKMFDDWILGLDNVDRSRLFQLTPRLAHLPASTVGLPPSDEVIVLSILDSLICNDGQWTGPHFAKVPSRNDCLWLFDFATEILLRWQREQRDRFTMIDTKYLCAIPELEQYTQ